MDAFAFLHALRFRIRKYLPTWLFDFLFSLWLNIGKKFLNAYYYLKLRSFKKPTTVNVEHGSVKFQICIDPKNGFIDEYIFLRGAYEPHILDLIQKHLPSNGIFFDVGANIGQHSLFAAACLRETGKVYAFEPLQSFYKQFQRSISLNGFNNIQVFNFACGNSTEQKQIYTKYDNAGGSSTVKLWEPDATNTIDIKKIDDMFGDIQKIDLMKIDVEGMEYAVLQGATNVITQLKPKLIIEFSPFIYQTYDPELIDLILDFVLSFYEVYDVDDGGYKIESKEVYLEDFNKRHRKQTNFLCLPR